MVMHPKSSATVVVVLFGTCPVRSMSALTDVIAASVRSGGISEIAPTVVVLPTPNPPAMTIFTGVGGRRLPAAGSANGFESTNDPFDHAKVLGGLGVWPPNDDIAERGEIGDQHPGDADMHAELGGDLGNGHGGLAQVDDVAPLEGQV